MSFKNMLYNNIYLYNINWTRINKIKKIFRNPDQ